MTAECDGGEGDTLILRKAVREVMLRFREIATELDPAPWYDVSAHEIEVWAEGDEKGFIRRKKLEIWAKCSLKIALLAGDLIAQFRDGDETCNVPGWAWQGVELDGSYWFDSCIPIDPFLPDEWFRWSGHDIFVDRGALNSLLTKADLGAYIESPCLPAPFDEANRPLPIKKRPPRDVTYVTLSEAVSWIAFGVSIDQDRLNLALEGMGVSRAESHAAVIAAMAKLADLGTGGKVAMRGKYIANYRTDERTVQTEPIDPVRLADFAQFDVLRDGLKFGQGLTWTSSESVLETALAARDDSFRCVTVSRADLMGRFPETDGYLHAMLTPLPASLPDIGPVMGLEEARNRLAYDAPAYDIDIWQNGAGDLTFTEPSGKVFAPWREGEAPPHHAQFIAANRQLHGALQKGTLPSFVAPAGGQPLAVPRLYWNAANPDLLDLTYGGLSLSDPGAGCPVLLSRLAFDAWRFGDIASIGNARAPAFKSGRPPDDSVILAKADEMKARGLDGRAIAKNMRLEAGFEYVATTAVRALIKGRWKPAGRPKKAA